MRFFLVGVAVALPVIASAVAWISTHDPLNALAASILTAGSICYLLGRVR